LIELSENILTGMKRTRDQLDADIIAVGGLLLTLKVQCSVLEDTSLALNPEESEISQEILNR
ncbi:hypothetical protein HK100_008567, partial [Physocladia obscura]